MIENIFQDEAATSNANPALEANKTHSAQGWHSHNVMTLNGQNDTNITSMRDYATLTLGELWSVHPTNRLKKDAPGFIPSSYFRYDARNHEVQRKRGSFVALTGDIDKGNIPSEHIIPLAQTLFGGSTAMFVYSTGSATKADKRWRIIVPLDDPVSFAQWNCAQKAFFNFMERDGVTMDRSLARAAQLVYLPNVPPDKCGRDGKPLYYVEHHEGMGALTL